MSEQCEAYNSPKDCDSTKTDDYVLEGDFGEVEKTLCGEHLDMHRNYGYKIVKRL